MEGQGFNPTPAPTPNPGVEPTPAPGQAPIEQTTEPVPQDSFAQPVANTGASWQPSQATAPQVGGMNIAPTMPMEAPAPKKTNVGLIISIVVASLVIIGLIVALIIVAANKDSGSKTSTETSENSGSESGSSSGSGGNQKSEEEKYKELQMSSRNSVRAGDLSRFMTAVNDYMTNNNGKTPFGTAGDGSDVTADTLLKFVSRYIDQDVVSVELGSQAKCEEGKSCVQFTDPGKGMYGFEIVKQEDIEEWLANKAEADHLITVVIQAGCGREEGTIKVGTTPRGIAMFYVEEGGRIICEDNH